MRKLLCLLIVAGILAWPRPAHAATNEVYWYGCYRTTNGAHFANGLDHLCREYPIRRAHTRLTGYTRHCRQTGIRIEVYCVRYPTFYVPPPPEPPVSSWPTVQRWSQYIYEAANRTGIPARVIAAVITVESAGDPYAVSYPSYGRADVGLMQVSYDAAVTVNGWYTYDPAANILTGSLYIDWLLRNCAGGNLYHAIAAFNGGCGGPNYAYAARVYQYV